MQLLTREDFIKKYANSIEKICKGTGVFPQTLFAIAIVESQSKAQDGKYYVGLSPLAKDYNNYFGIKATANWKGKKVKLNTPNDFEKKSVFRVYNNFVDSAKDFIKFLKENPRYKKAGVFNAKTYPEQIISIARAGYSESETYSKIITQVADKINKYIESYIKPIQKKIIKGLPIILLLGGLSIYLYNKNQKQKLLNYE